MNYPTRLIFIAICLSASNVIAEPVYKSVNEKGEITFSDSPPPAAVDVQQIQVQPAPTESQVQESQAREKRINAQANELGAANAQRQQNRQQVATPATPYCARSSASAESSLHPRAARPIAIPTHP